MSIKFIDVGGSFEAAFDGVGAVILRTKGSHGPNFHLSRDLICLMLRLFPEGAKRWSASINDVLQLTPHFNGSHVSIHEVVRLLNDLGAVPTLSAGQDCGEQDCGEQEGNF